jgi:hypothetical protein
MIGLRDPELDRLLVQHPEGRQAGLVQGRVAPARLRFRSHDRQEFLLPIDVALPQPEAFAGPHAAKG